MFAQQVLHAAETFARKVSLPRGLREIQGCAFYSCQNLLEIYISKTVGHIGEYAFAQCELLAKVEFEISRHHHELRNIWKAPFLSCTSLPRIKLPSSVNWIAESLFESCSALIEANLSTTGITEIESCTFYQCTSLETVSLPYDLTRICQKAFYNCTELVTVVVPMYTRCPIRIETKAFWDCRRLSNLCLPKDSIAMEDSFSGCDLLRDCFGEESSRIVANLVDRYSDKFYIHEKCYDHIEIDEGELENIPVKYRKEDVHLVAVFGMTPFHVLFSTPEPTLELLKVLLDVLPNETLKLKDANAKRPLDYLMSNWTDETADLLRRTLQKWMIDRLARWGATAWMETIQSKMQGILAGDGKEQRSALCDEVHALLEQYENVEATSILEMALWKWKLMPGWTSSNVTKRLTLDRDECRCLSGSNIVIPHVAIFLGEFRSS